MLVRVYDLHTTLDLFVDSNVPHAIVTCGGCLANWERRTKIIDYCVDVLDTSYEENKRIAEKTGGNELRVRRKAQAELYSSDIKVSGDPWFLSDLTRSRLPVFDVQRTQLHNERAVETIVRERSAKGMNLVSLTDALASL